MISGILFYILNYFGGIFSFFVSEPEALLHRYSFASTLTVIRRDCYVSLKNYIALKWTH